jgi:hypothetical protein
VGRCCLARALARADGEEARAPTHPPPTLPQTAADGAETGNIITGNLGILTRASDALLNTDTTPATFWITHPNNTYRDNMAAGSLNGYGYWYRLLDFPEGPSYTWVGG